MASPLSAAGIEPDEVTIDRLIADMTLDESSGQLNLRGRGSRSSFNEIPAELEQAVREGRVGGLINVMLPDAVERLQRIARKESPHGQLRFHDGDGWVLEPGRFRVWIAPDAASGFACSFELR